MRLEFEHPLTQGTLSYCHVIPQTVDQIPAASSLRSDHWGMFPLETGHHDETPAETNGNNNSTQVQEIYAFPQGLGDGQ